VRSGVAIMRAASGQEVEGGCVVVNCQFSQVTSFTFAIEKLVLSFRSSLFHQFTHINIKIRFYIDLFSKHSHNFFYHSIIKIMNTL